LLEPVEIYFDDYSVWYFPEQNQSDSKRSLPMYECDS
jgi:hypothetical protein